MRIIAGEFRGRRLGRPPQGVRPTSDRVRESVFARLGGLEGARVLDLCAGTGALGFEALSRGAERVVFVERAKAAVTAIERNAALLGVGPRSRVVAREARGALRALAEAAEVFDLILIDPPYEDHAAVGPWLESIVADGLLAAGGTVVVESAKRHAVAPTAGLAVESTRRYGDTSITWLIPADGDAAMGGTGQR